MLKELATQTGAQGWAIASMLFFFAVYLVVALRTWRATRSEVRAVALLPLEDDPSHDPDRPRGDRPRA
jgi:cbb3-type cytochrome oxidase subunit 3